MKDTLRDKMREAIMVASAEILDTHREEVLKRAVEILEAPPKEETTDNVTKL